LNQYIELIEEIRSSKANNNNDDDESKKSPKNVAVIKI